MATTSMLVFRTRRCLSLFVSSNTTLLELQTLLFLFFPKMATTSMLVFRTRRCLSLFVSSNTTLLLPKARSMDRVLVFFQVLENQEGPRILLWHFSTEKSLKKITGPGKV